MLQVHLDDLQRERVVVRNERDAYRVVAARRLGLAAAAPGQLQRLVEDGLRHDRLDAVALDQRTDRVFPLATLRDHRPVAVHEVRAVIDDARHGARELDADAIVVSVRRSGRYDGARLVGEESPPLARTDNLAEITVGQVSQQLLSRLKVAVPEVSGGLCLRAELREGHG